MGESEIDWARFHAALADAVAADARDVAALRAQMPEHAAVALDAALAHGATARLHGAEILELSLAGCSVRVHGALRAWLVVAGWGARVVGDERVYWPDPERSRSGDARSRIYQTAPPSTTVAALLPREHSDHDCAGCGVHHGTCARCGATHGDSHSPSCPHTLGTSADRCSRCGAWLRPTEACRCAEVR